MGYFHGARHEYIPLMLNAIQVWCFTDYHKSFLVHDHGFNPDDIHTIPLFVRPIAVPTEPWETSVTKFLDSTARTEIDIAFSGTNSNRREKILRSIYDRAVSNGFSCEMSIVAWYDLPFGENRYISLRRSKVILNVHFDETSSLEVHRINHLLALGKCVISERSINNPALDSAFEDAVVFADNSVHMYELAAYYARNDTARMEIERRAYAKYLEISKDLTALSHAMNDIVRKLMK